MINRGYRDMTRKQGYQEAALSAIKIPLVLPISPIPRLKNEQQLTVVVVLER